ncbi:hypothetical protein K7B10_02655 [Streptomyces flavotricini]|uniref:Ig-like domain-containing protein n=1 Tax=Streptomyces flavotricini TaxID=66888 RepID=A0ABS8DYA4_9ACTN|nr:hypothetical protein [Streptomyces flavotricini]MCC0093707.1 hypothetical protein [Streptomyces flavotricini]
MNRHARYALLTPLLACSVALPPTMAAQAAPVAHVPATLGAAPQAATCKLEVAEGTDPVEFDLSLAGFKPGSQVRVTGPENFTRTVNQQGSVTEQDVKKGTYTVKTGGKNHSQTVNCTKPARVPASAKARITDVDITGASTATPKVDCSQPQNVKFEGKLTGTGSGDVTYIWSGQGKRSAPSVKFTAPSTAAAPFTAKSTARAAATNPAPRVTATLTDSTGNVQDQLTFTLTCQ